MGQALTHTMDRGAAGMPAPRRLLWGVGLALSLLVGATSYMAAEKVVHDDASRRFEALGRSMQTSLSAHT